jgi:hypothetical protein
MCLWYMKKTTEHTDGSGPQPVTEFIQLRTGATETPVLVMVTGIQGYKLYPGLAATGRGPTLTRLG